MENTNRLWRAPGFRRNALLMSVELLWEAEKGECVLIYTALFLDCQLLCSVHFTTIRCCETSIWCLLLWLTSLWFSSLLERILSCQVNLQGLGCSHGPLVRIQTIPHFPLANVSRGQSPSSLQKQCFTEGNSHPKNSLTLCVLLYLIRLGLYEDATQSLWQLPCECWTGRLEGCGAAWVPGEGQLGKPCQRAVDSHWHCCCSCWRLKGRSDAKQRICVCCELWSLNRAQFGSGFGIPGSPPSCLEIQAGHILGWNKKIQPHIRSTSCAFSFPPSIPFLLPSNALIW